MPPLRPLSIDWASEDTWFAVGAGILGIAVGIGAPAAYVLLQQSDEKKLEELRELNRQSYKETGQYMSEVTLWLRQLAHRPHMQARSRAH